MTSTTEAAYAAAMAEQAAKDTRAQIKAGNMGFRNAGAQATSALDKTGKTTPILKAAMRGQGWMSVADIAEASNVSVSMIQRIMPRLLAEGIAEKDRRKHATQRGLSTVTTWRLKA